MVLGKLIATVAIVVVIVFVTDFFIGQSQFHTTSNDIIPKTNTCVFTSNLELLNDPNIPVNRECSYEKGGDVMITSFDFTQTGGKKGFDIQGDDVKCIITSGLSGDIDFIDTISAFIRGVPLKDINTDQNVSCFNSISFLLDDWLVIEDSQERITFRLRVQV